VYAQRYKYFATSSGKNNRTNLPVSSGLQATFGKLLRVTGGYWKGRTSSLKRVSKGFSKLVRDFKEGNFKKTSSTHSKSTCRKNIHLVTLSLSTEGKTRLRRGRLIYKTLLLIVEQKC